MKPLQIKITSCDEAMDEMSTADKANAWDALVSCTTADPLKVFHHLPNCICWLDMDDKTPWELPDDSRLWAGVAEFRHVMSLVVLAGELKNNARVLVHCGAGCCRSTAAAMVLLAAAGWPDHVAVAKVRSLKSGRGIPNGWLLKLADALFDTNLFGCCAESGNTKWTPPWLRGVPWTTAEREAAK